VGDTGPELIGAGPPELENIFVNSPGPDGGADLSAAANETWEGGVGVGDTGPGLMGDIPPELENILVNSPGPDGGATCGVGEAGAGAIGVLQAGGAGSGEALPPTELNIRVNAPGPDDPAVAADPAFGSGDAVEIPTVGSFGGFSMATGLKTRATSSVRPVPDVALEPALEPALPLAPGIVSACSMRVNSPGLREASGCTGGVGVGAMGVLATVAAGCGAAAASGFGEAAGGSASGAFGVACPSSDASRSSSARGEAATCPKTPVALDGWSVLGESEESNGFLGASMRGHLAW
jgi:hypothetical protein